MQSRYFSRHCHFFSSLILVITMTTKAVAMPPPPQTSLLPAEEVKDFYQKAKEGWFWYQDPLPEEEPEVHKQGDPVVTTEAGPKQYETRNPSLKNYTIQQVWNMHPDEFHGLLNSIEKKAVQTPSEENILEYAMIQDVARRKALAFSNATMFVTQKYSEKFNINQDVPITAPGISAKVQEREAEINNTLLNAKEDHALLFFVAQGCGFCDKQAAILTYFVEQYGWQIKAIDIGQHPTVAARFNITSTPTLVLVKNGSEQTMPISVGVTALPDMQHKLYQAIRYLAGDTDIESFQTFDYQKGGALDPGSILDKEEQPWVPYEK